MRLLIYEFYRTFCNLFYFTIMIIKSVTLVMVFLTSVVLYYAAGESENKGSLAFVIDKTNSMGTVIKAVKKGASDIFNTVTSFDESPIENYVLVTFGDPNVSDAIITKNITEFKEVLNSTRLENGDDCPELSMTGIKKALDESLPGSYIYVFTDASAKDFEILDQVESRAQEKGCQVVFILTGECDKNSTVNEVYHKLAEATSGQVFNMLSQDIDQILKYVSNSITSRRIIMHTGKYLPGNNTAHYKLDARSNNITIAISGYYPRATVRGPDGETIVEEIVSLNEILVLKDIEDSMPGDYSVNFTSNKSAHIVVSARSDVRFHHGFSTALPSTFNDSVFKPFSDVKNYLTIKIFGENVSITTAKFLDSNYHNLSLDIPLYVLDKKQKLNVTGLIDPPKSSFRIVVKGVDLNTNTPITRFGTMLLQPDTHVHKKPTVNIETKDKVIVDYKAPLKLNCTVEAYPKPTITWKDIDGIPLPATISQVSLYGYINTLELENVYKNSTYECAATNKMGNVVKSVQVEVKPEPYLRFTEKPANVEVKYNSDAVLHCKVDAYPPAKISWWIPKGKRYYSKKAKVLISSDGSTLTIKNMEQSAAGKYACKAENVYKTEYARATVTLSSKKPKINNTLSEVHVREDTSALLTCNLLEAEPTPEIWWYRKHSMSAKYIEIEEGRNQTSISLKHVNRYDTGIYKCKAKNELGIDTHIMDFFVDCPPTIKDDVKLIKVRKGDQLNMTCVVQGIPTPKVVWLKDKSPIDSEIHILRDYSFKIEADFHHGGNYTCTSTNLLGSAVRTVKVFVYFLHITPPKKKYSVDIGSDLDIECNAEGIPTPDLKWVFYSFNETIPPRILSTTESTYTIESIKDDERGAYMCVASNIGGSLNITHIVDVLSAPLIQSDLKDVYEAVEGDRLLKIHCRATGNPKPKITWAKSGAPLAGDKYYIEEDWLEIKYLDMSDTSKYDCTADNSIYSDTKIFRVKVLKYPPADSIINTTTVLIREGETALIKCYVPHKAVDELAWYKDKMLIHKGKLELRKAKITDSGVYTCRVSHLDSPIMDSANTKVIVESKLKFITEEEAKVELEFGQSGYLNCKATGEPELTVNWSHNKVSMIFTDMVYNFEMGTETVGEYTCRISNDFKSISRTFSLSLKGCVIKIDKDSKDQPLMLTTSGDWPMFKSNDGLIFLPESQDLLLSCPKHFTRFDRTDVIAQCDQGTKLKINEALYDYTDIKCNKEVSSHIISTREPCLGNDTKKIKHVFNVSHKTIEVYEVCVDKHGNPIYAKHFLGTIADDIPNDTSIFDDSKSDVLYKCKKSKKFFVSRKLMSSKGRGCCFTRRHLINPKDVFPGPSQRTTFSRLNMVLHWSSCNAENWNEVEERVRKLSKLINKDLIVFTGGSHYQSTIKGQPIYVYLWKVVQFPADGSSLAIIQLNIPDLTPSEVDKYVLCRDICPDVSWMSGSRWHNIEKGYTFCCNLRDFETAFSSKGQDLSQVFEPLDKVLDITI